MMTEIADAGNEVWISIEGPGAGQMVAILHDEHGVVIDQLVEVEAWFFRARVVNYDPDSFRLEGFMLNDGTYVSEVDDGLPAPNEGATEADEEARDTDDESI